MFPNVSFTKKYVYKNIQRFSKFGKLIVLCCVLYDFLITAKILLAMIKIVMFGTFVMR